MHVLFFMIVSSLDKDCPGQGKELGSITYSFKLFFIASAINFSE